MHDNLCSFLLYFFPIVVQILSFIFVKVDGKKSLFSLIRCKTLWKKPRKDNQPGSGFCNKSNSWLYFAWIFLLRLKLSMRNYIIYFSNMKTHVKGAHILTLSWIEHEKQSYFFHYILLLLLTFECDYHGPINSFFFHNLNGATWCVYESQIHNRHTTKIQDKSLERTEIVIIFFQHISMLLKH